MSMQSVSKKNNVVIRQHFLPRCLSKSRSDSLLAQGARSNLSNDYVVGCRVTFAQGALAKNSSTRINICQIAWSYYLKTYKFGQRFNKNAHNVKLVTKKRQIQ